MNRPGGMDETWEDAASALGTVIGVPLPPAVRDLLLSLQPPRSTSRPRSRRGSPAGRPLVEPGGWHGPAESSDLTAGTPLAWVGPVHRHDPRGVPLLAWWSGASSPPRVTPQDVHRGRPFDEVAARRGPILLVLAPAGVDPDGLNRGGSTRDENLRPGVTEILWSFVPPAAAAPPETVRSPARGDLTAVDLRGTTVLVHHASVLGTDLSWSATIAGTRCSVRLRTSCPPLEAVERLARDTVLLGPTPPGV